MADTGWPIPFDEVDRYAARTRAVLQVPTAAEAMRDAIERGGRKLVPLPEAQVETSLLQFSPLINFVGAYRDALFAAPNVTTVLYANVTAIETQTGSGRGTGHRPAAVRRLSGNGFTARSRVFVLATGAIESARLLPTSDIGNQHDNVGREDLHMGCGEAARCRGL